MYESERSSMQPKSKPTSRPDAAGAARGAIVWLPAKRYIKVATNLPADTYDHPVYIHNILEHGMAEVFLVRAHAWAPTAAPKAMGS
jgi:hypothetical protein